MFSMPRRWGLGQADMIHISFGSVLGKDGRPMKTRKGDLVELGFLLDESVRRAAQVYEQNVQESLERGEEVEHR